MHRRSVVVAFSILTIFMLAGCTPQTEAIVPTPIPTNTALPTDTPVPPTATSEPTPTIEEQDLWLSATELPESLAGALVRCPDQPDSFYVVGGITARNEHSAWFYQYDIPNATWEQLADMPIALRGHVAACYEGKIYLAGGTDFTMVSNILYIYDIALDQWSEGPAWPDPVVGGAIGAWDGKLYLVGGSRDLAQPDYRVDVYDIATGIWTAGGGAALPFPTWGFAHAQAGQFLYLVGGNGRSAPVDNTLRYDMSTNTWEMGPSFTSQRSYSGLAVTATHLYVMGGDIDDGSDVFHSTTLVEVLDLSTWPEGEWVDLGIPLPTSNLLPATTCTETLTGGEIWMVGGGTSANICYPGVYYLPVEEGCP